MPSVTSPASPMSESQMESPRSNRSSSNERYPRQLSRSRSRTATPEHMSDNSRSPSKSPKSQHSRASSSSESYRKEDADDREEVNVTKTGVKVEKNELDMEKSKDGGIIAEDIFGDNLSISSEDEDDKSSKQAVIEDQNSNDNAHRVQRYGDEHREGTSSDSSASTKGSSRIRSRSRSRSKSDGVDNVRRYEEEDRENAHSKVQESASIFAEMPKITTDMGKDMYFVKLPNFLSVESKPFIPETHEDEIEEDLQLDEEGNVRLKLKVENTIRWRQAFNSEGKYIKESNARIVRWSNGTMSLHLGSEVFDIQRLPLTGDFNHMFIRQGAGLQGQAIFRNKLSFRPHSTESHTHQKMTSKMVDRQGKGHGIKVISKIGSDPEIGHYKKVKEEEKRLKADLKKESMVYRKKERGAGKSLSKSFLEAGDSDEDGVSVAQIKNRYKKRLTERGDYLAPRYASDELDSDVETKKGRRLEKAKAAIRDSEESSVHSDVGSVNSSKSKRSNVSGRSRLTSLSPNGSSRSQSVARTRYRSRSDSRSPSESRSNSIRNRSRSTSPNKQSRATSRSGSDSD